MSYKISNVPEPLNFWHVDDDTDLFEGVTHARDLLQSYVRDKLTWPDMKYLDGIRIRKFKGRREIKPSYLVDLTKGVAV